MDARFTSYSRQSLLLVPAPDAETPAFKSLAEPSGPFPSQEAALGSVVNVFLQDARSREFASVVDAIAEKTPAELIETKGCAKRLRGTLRSRMGSQTQERSCLERMGTAPEEGGG